MSEACRAIPLTEVFGAKIDIKATGDVLRIQIQGDCDFATAREMLLQSRRRLAEGGISHIKFCLENVGILNTCTIGAMLLLSEAVQGQFQVSIKQCSPDIHWLLESEMLKRHFGNHYSTSSSTAPHRECEQCLHYNCQHPGPSCVQLSPSF